MSEIPRVADIDHELSIATFRFNLTGEISKTTNSKNDQNHMRAVLNANRTHLSCQIEDQLRVKLLELFQNEPTISLNLHFTNGSILFFGPLQIIGMLADLAVTISLVDMIRRLIGPIVKDVLFKFIQEDLSRSMNDDASWRITVHSIPMPPRIQSYSHHTTPTVANGNGQEALLSFNLRTALLWITLANLTLFLGGTLFTAVQVDSIQERYQAAKNEISEIRRDYEDYRRNVESQLMETSAQLRQSTLTTTQEVTELQTKLKGLSRELVTTDTQLKEIGEGSDSLNKKLAEHRAALEKVIEANDSWISLPMVWEEVNVTLKALIASLITLTVLSFAFGVWTLLRSLI